MDRLRPFTGSSCTCRGSTFPATAEVVTSMSGAAPVTVTVSVIVLSGSCTLTTAVWPSSSSTPRLCVVNPVSITATWTLPTRTGSR
jgi:hypothetical protein